MPRHPSVDNSNFRLRRSGWSASDVVLCGPGGKWYWFVTARKADDWLRSRGHSQEEAWDEAAQQAESIDWDRPEIHAEPVTKRHHLVSLAAR